MAAFSRARLPFYIILTRSVLLWVGIYDMDDMAVWWDETERGLLVVRDSETGWAMGGGQPGWR